MDLDDRVREIEVEMASTKPSAKSGGKPLLID